MTWLVTGGCGFMGTNLTHRLLELDRRVVIVDDLSRVGAERNLTWLREHPRGQLAFHQIDVANAPALTEVFRAENKRSLIEAVAHLAGQVAMTTSLADPRRDFRTNALGTFNVLEAVRSVCPAASVLYSSTNKVYGDLRYIETVEQSTRYALPQYAEGLPEALLLDFSSPYGCSKGAADQYVRDWHRIFGLKTIVFRHSSAYGSRQFATIDQGWVGWFCQKALEQQADPDAPPFTVSGDGKQVRDLLHGDDLVALYLAGHERIDDAAGQIFNVGGGASNSYSILELIGFLQESLEIQMNYNHIDERQHDQKVFVADIRKANEVLGWRPTVSKTEGVTQLLAWVKSSSAAGQSS